MPCAIPRPSGKISPAPSCGATSAAEPILPGDVLRPGDHGFRCRSWPGDAGGDGGGGCRFRLGGADLAGRLVDLLLTQTLDQREDPARRVVGNRAARCAGDRHRPNDRARSGGQLARRSAASAHRDAGGHPPPGRTGGGGHAAGSAVAGGALGRRRRGGDRRRSAAAVDHLGRRCVACPARRRGSRSGADPTMRVFSGAGRSEEYRF